MRRSLFTTSAVEEEEEVDEENDGDGCDPTSESRSPAPAGYRRSPAPTHAVGKSQFKHSAALPLPEMRTRFYEDEVPDINALHVSDTPDSASLPSPACLRASPH